MSLIGPTFVQNPLFVGQLLRSTMLDDDLLDVAEEIAEKAKGLAPVDSGDYRDGILAEVGQGSDGAEAQVVGTAMHSGFVEFGTVHNPAYAPIRRGAEASGYPVSGS